MNFQDNPGQADLTERYPEGLYQGDGYEDEHIDPDLVHDSYKEEPHGIEPERLEIEYLVRDTKMPMRTQMDKLEELMHEQYQKGITEGYARCSRRNHPDYTGMEKKDV